ncbi:hypothetical protein JXA05_02045 [Candidatus Peregrinibacteria bacterium]|nr:hypothetical protein [Candidatus Peregrinibacteria bacterium]
MFFRLSPEEKVAGLGMLVALVALFMPWYSVVFTFDKKSVSQSGFAGDLGVLGFIIFIMVILAALTLTGEYLHFRLPRLGYGKEQILLFLMGESAFLTLIAIAVYTKRSLEFTSAELRFGIYLALVGALLSTFAVYAQMQKFRKKDVESFFEHPEPKPKKSRAIKEEAIEEAGEEAEKGLFEPEKEMPLSEESDFLVDRGVEEEALPEKTETVDEFEPEPEPEDQEIAEEEPAVEAAEEEPVAEEEILEEEIVEIETEQAEEELPAEKEPPEEEDQKEKNEEEEREDKKKDSALKLDFYQDE